MDEELYESVLCACTLNKDVSNWVNGDLILVRERERHEVKWQSKIGNSASKGYLQRFRRLFPGRSFQRC
ncbi:hypothetical protein HYC85_006247 [Camellia sinensis]|uniref:Uncharacterized protein n=1 Tax=Camellia sinensis TaxID=4442 RepID=A0A7J7HME9_CAMSI|nr:hypothetical protein HYC85_006247 [Camellia sinensis]